MAKIPEFLFGHVLDGIGTVIRFVSENLDKSICPKQWALCYDELEIAPGWLREELISGLRSGPQDILLKLTWYPILPSGVLTSPGPTNDFRPIRLWHSHLDDPKAFCEDITCEFLRRKFGDKAPTPAEFFRRSVFASEGEDEPAKAYERDSTEYKAFVSLAVWDKSFERVLVNRGIDPKDPVPKDQAQKDQFFRKVKPIVLVRNAFATQMQGASRKAPALYVGREAIYAVSEGNPRWLQNLLSDLVDIGEPNEDNSLGITYASQGKIITNAAGRLRALIKASPFKPPEQIVGGSEHTLVGFVETLGEFFREQIHNRSEFSEDPIGSFEFPTESDGLYSAMVTQLLEIGALVYVGMSQQDVPASINRSRFRLSFMLAPLFRLPFRNFKAVSLSAILTRKIERKQLEFDALP